MADLKNWYAPLTAKKIVNVWLSGEHDTGMAISYKAPIAPSHLINIERSRLPWTRRPLKMIPHERIGGRFSIDLFRLQKASERSIAFIAMWLSAPVAARPWNTPRPVVIINYRADKSIARAFLRATRVTPARYAQPGKIERRCKKRCKLAGNR